MAKKPPMVRVEWVDAASHGEGWIAKSETLPLGEVTTVGYLIEKTPEKVLVAGSISQSQYGETIAIPRPCVKRIVRLREG